MHLKKKLTKDIDGNGFLDEFEIEAMFQHEVC